MHLRLFAQRAGLRRWVDQGLFSRLQKKTRIHPWVHFSALGLAIENPSYHAPSPWMMTSVIVGLPLALWAYKCAMMVIFQRKIIYMGYIPLGARTEDIESEALKESDISCEEFVVKSTSNVKLACLIAKRPSTEEPQTIVVYFQGNAGNPLHRIPVFRALLKAYPSLGPRANLPHRASHNSVVRDSTNGLGLAIVAVAPRSYWKSSNKTPTEQGLLDGYRHALDHVLKVYPSADVFVYGHSLGGAVATCLLSRLHELTSHSHDVIKDNIGDYARIRGLILENPFSSIPGMVRALYPQKWLPYHYLAPLAFDKWDAVASIEQATSDSTLYRLRHNTLVLLSEHDELVPRSMGESIWDSLCNAENYADQKSGRKIVIERALHEDAWRRPQWAREVCHFINQTCNDYNDKLH